MEPRLALAGIPALSSLPGANQTIYLDFDGHTTTGTYWNNSYGASFTNQPYDTDGVVSTDFSATEVAAIQEAWQRVSEDFIPFNVNVTTVDPGVEALRKSGTGDTQWGVRAVITKDTVMACGCGGIAYIDSFNWNTDTPVFVYTTGGKSVAEAASHEIGHALGLAHDGTNANPSYYGGHGTGETGWAPIMGVGYSKNVTQWDRGEYYDANNGGATANYSKGPDDLAVITTYNGFDYRTDAVGNTISTATPLTATGGTSVSGSGIIERTTDVDIFSFTTGAGTVSFNASPYTIGATAATSGANLDVKLQLLDSAGNVVATADPSTTLSASLTATVAAGQYFLSIDGTGFGTPAVSPPTGYSDYASLGRYSFTGTIVPAVALPALSINDVSVNEAAGTATLTVSISGTVTSNVSVSYATADGTAISGSDYTAVAGTLTFVSGGATTQTIVVPIINDTTSESTEGLVVNLSSVSGATITDGQGSISITDNDQATLSINDVTATEGNLRNGRTTTKNFTFTVRLSSPQSTSVTVRYATQDGTATTGNNDYKSLSGTLTFSAGQTSKTFSVKVVGDNTAESNETFNVILSNAVGAGIADNTGVGTIQNDDGGAAALLAALYGEDNDLPDYSDEMLLELLHPHAHAMSYFSDAPAAAADEHADHDQVFASLPSNNELQLMADRIRSFTSRSAANSATEFDDSEDLLSVLAEAASLRSARATASPLDSTSPRVSSISSRKELQPQLQKSVTSSVTESIQRRLKVAAANSSLRTLPQLNADCVDAEAGDNTI